MVYKSLRSYNAITVLLRCLAGERWQILHQVFILVLLSNTGARRLDYSLVNKIFILVFYSSPVIFLVGNRNIMVDFIMVHAYLFQDIVTKLSIIFDHRWGQKWVIVRPWVFLVETCRELGVRVGHLPCILLTKVVHCFDFAFQDLEPGLHALTAVALQATNVELTELGLAIRA